MNNSIQAEKIADNARNSISNYCMEECSAYCCRKGYLILSKKEMQLLVKDKEIQLTKEEFIRPLIDGKYSVSLGNSSGSCPSLINSKCTLHKDPKRPLVCKEFPIFITENVVRISDRCPAKKVNKFYSHIRELIDLDYEVV
ncbi:MAG: YkgJ family cysteine cluster protein [Nanoarchaeota archaeon]|jgi:Fe-S-cluster containining protein|nr:YkgJ family cysteine cluster protein [Nanoarchaeota archaeon]